MAVADRRGPDLRPAGFRAVAVHHRPPGL